MRGRLLVLAVVAALSAGAAFAGGAAAQQAAPQLTPVGRLSFPERGFLVGLARHVSLAPTDVRVRENGRAVVDPSFVPVSQATQRLGVVLVVDASNSMRGQPIKDAFDAARGFVDQVGASERIGVLTFNPTSHLVLAPTQNPAQLARALRHAPRTAEGTHIYDALARALAVLRAQKVAAGAIVLLSDGADTGSQTPSASVLAHARAEHVRIFTVGLRSAAFQAAPLRALAAGSGAAYSEAGSSAELKRIYDALGAQLASEYLLRYRSAAKPGERVTVAVQVVGSAESDFTYTAQRPHAVSPFHRSLWQRFWSWSGSFVVIALLVMGLVFGAAYALLHSPPSNLRRRLAEFISITGAASEQPAGRRLLPLPRTLLSARTEEALAHNRWWTRFKEEVEIAEINLRPEQIVLGALVLTLFVFVLLLLVLPVFSIFALAVPIVVRALCRRQLQQVRERFAEQLPDNLQVLASALRAGHSLIGALAVVAADAEAPSRREFQRVVADEQLGVPIERSMREVARRMDSADLEQVALVAELQRQAGGNMAEVLDRVVDTIRARFDLRRLVKTLTAQGRMARWIVSLLPVALAAIISVLNPGYMSPLFGSTGGQVAVAFAIAMVIAGSLVIKRIINFKV